MAERDLELALRIRALVQGAQSIEDLQNDLGGLADEIERAANPTDDFNQGLDQLDQSSRKAAEGAKTASGAVGEFGELLKGLATAAAVKQIIDLNDQLTGLRRGFEVVTGSSTEAAEALDFVRGVSDRLGVSNLDLAQSFLKLVAASKGTALEGAQTEQIFSSLAGAMSTVGASAADVDNAMTALSQIMSKGTVSSEELTGQLGDVLPGAAQQAAQALLVSNAELRNMLEAGEVLASEFLPKFAVQLETAMGGGSQQVETFAASWQRLTNQLTDLATGPVGKGLTDFLSGLLNTLTPISRGAIFASDAIGAIGTALGGLAAGEGSAALEDLGAAATDASSRLFGIKTAAQQAAETQRQMAEELRALTPEMDRFQDAVSRGDLKSLPENLQAAISELKKTGDVAEATEQAVSKFIASVNQRINFNGVIELSGALNLLRQEAGTAASEISGALANALSNLSDDQLERLRTQAQTAMAAASQGSEQARKAFADLGLIVESVVSVQLQRAAESADKLSASAGQYTSALEAVGNAQLEGLRQEIALAKAKGNTSEVQQKTIALAELEARWSKSVAAAKQAEIQAEIAAAQAKIASINASESNQELKQAEISAINLQIQALLLESETIGKTAEIKKQILDLNQKQKQATDIATSSTQQNTIAIAENSNETEKAVKSGGGLAKVIGSLIDFWKQKTGALSAATQALFEFNAGISKVDPQASRDLIGGISEEADVAAKKIGELTAFIRQMDTQILNSTGSVGRFMDMIQRSGAAAERAYYEQKLQAEELEQRLQSIGDTGGRSFANIDAALRSVNVTAANTRDSLFLLNEQDLSQLQDAIDGANEKLHQMQEETQSAKDRLTELNAELLESKGLDEKARILRQELDYQQQLSEIEMQRREAELEGNRALLEILDQQKQTLDEINSRKLDAIKREDEERKRSSSSSSSSSSAGGTSSGGRGAAGGSGVSINVNAPGARILDRAFVEDLARQMSPILGGMNRRTA